VSVNWWKSLPIPVN